MNINDLARDYGLSDESQSRYCDMLTHDLVEYRAREKDNEIQSRLLRTIILDYAALERQLVELNNLKNKFLGMAAHDLRNPLTSIRGFCEILQEDEDDLNEDQKEMLGIIHETSETMLALVNDLLDVSVIESGKLQLNRASTSLREVIEDRVRLNSIPARKKNIEIACDLADDVPDLSFDRNKIGQVIDNLIGNAVKFSPFDTHILVSLLCDGPLATVSVADEGPGITPEDQAKLFGEFQRLSARPTGGEKSTGLGLAIVKKIVEAHGGTITADSTPGKGSVFRFSLPV